MRRTGTPSLSAALFVTGLLALTGCGATAPTASPANGAASPSALASGPASSNPASSNPASSVSVSGSPPAEPSSAKPSKAKPAATDGPVPVSKLLVFVVENHSLSQMRAQMPFSNGLAERYGYAAEYRAITHPSLPNYLAIAGGDTFGVTNDAAPAAHPLPGASVFGRAVRHGSTARLYAEDMTSPCQPKPAGRYAVKHNPWAYFVNESALCRRDDVGLQRYPADVAAGNLPAVGMVIPNLCEDAHDCPLARADDWLRREVGRAMSGPDWKSGRLAVVITADEDDKHHGNRILTVLAQRDLRHRVVSTPLNHYALSRAYADVAGFAPLGHAAQAPDLLGEFGLRVANG